jgi:hypothetical protein
VKPAPFDPLFPGCCSLAHGEGVPRAVTGPDVDVTGADLPFCEPHMALVPKALRRKLEAIAGVSIFDVDRHQEVRELLAQATKAAGARPVAGICSSCGCTDAAPCDGGCAWANRAHTLCTACERYQAELAAKRRRKPRKGRR